jgi:transcription antitermination factor NusG
MSNELLSDSDITWLLLYTKPNAEAWTEVNLRNQGYVSLIPRVAQRGGFRPLFPRYVFAGHSADLSQRPLASTSGVLYVVACGDRPARVPHEVIQEIRARMNENGVVQLEPKPAPDALFAQRERERVRALVKLAHAGFRVKSA